MALRDLQCPTHADIGYEQRLAPMRVSSGGELSRVFARIPIANSMYATVTQVTRDSTIQRDRDQGGNTMTVSRMRRARVRAAVGRRGWRVAAVVVAGACIVAGPGATANADHDASARGATQVTLPEATCPTSLPDDTTCYSGRQQSGSYYWIAVPEDWAGDLVVHAHGGPGLGEADPERSLDDLDRWSMMVKEGYAWAATSYRRGGYGAQMAATDTEQVRRLFVRAFGEPDTTLLHGQSWGGNVAAKLLEMYGKRGSGPYDGALFTNGVLGGGTRGYDYRLDLRVVYQYYCHNHPRPDERQYALWRGLPADSTMTNDDPSSGSRSAPGTSRTRASVPTNNARRCRTSCR